MRDRSSRSGCFLKSIFSVKTVALARGGRSLIIKRTNGNIHRERTSERTRETESRDPSLVLGAGSRYFFQSDNVVLLNQHSSDYECARKHGRASKIESELLCCLPLSDRPGRARIIIHGCRRRRGRRPELGTQPRLVFAGRRLHAGDGVSLHCPWRRAEQWHGWTVRRFHD